MSSSKSWFQKVGIAALAAAAVYIIFRKPKANAETQNYIDGLKQGFGLEIPGSVPEEVDMDLLADAWKEAPLQNGSTQINLYSEGKTNRFDRFLDVLQKGPVMDTLTINFPINSTQIIALVKAIAKNKIKSIDFENQSSLSSQDITMLIDAIQQSKGMDTVSFVFSDSKLSNIFDIFPKVQNLSFRLTDMTNQDAQNIADALQKSNLKEVSLFLNNSHFTDTFTTYMDAINNQGLEKLQIAFAQTPSIQKLNIFQGYVIPTFPSQLPGWQSGSGYIYLEKQE